MDQEIPKSFIQVIFADFGSVMFQVNWGEVSAMQVLALSEYLHFKGEMMLAQDEHNRMQEQERNKIAVPKIDVARR